MAIIKLGKFEARWGTDSPAIIKDAKANGLVGNGLVLNSDNDEMIAVMKQLSDMVYPVASLNRQTIPDYKNLANVLGDILLINPEFQYQWLDALEQLAMWDPDVSNAIENISLANTPFKTTFAEGTPDSLQREAQAYLTESRDRWYDYGDGYNGFMDDLLAQCAYSGVMSYEAIINKNIDSIAKIDIVNPRNILFYRDSNDNGIYPIQKIPSQYLNVFLGYAVMGHYKKLNTITYRYSALRRLGENPIGVPPFLAGMEKLMIRKDMDANLQIIMKKLGVLGFLTVMMNRPDKRTGESDSAYQARLQTAVEENAASFKQGMNSSFMMGWKGMNDIEFVSINGNAKGASELYDIADRGTITGLKQSMEMMNRKHTTTETFGRVVLAKMGKQLEKYQNLLATNTSYLDLMQLQLAGYPITKVITKFDKVMLGDKLKEAQAHSSEIDNVNKLYDAGLISQDTRANMLDIDKPDQKEPRVATPTPGVKPPIDTKTNSKVRVHLPEKFIHQLQGMEEKGIGYHKVHIHVDEFMFNDIVVINCEWAYMDIEIDVNEITKIENA